MVTSRSDIGTYIVHDGGLYFNHPRRVGAGDRLGGASRPPILIKIFAHLKIYRDGFRGMLLIEQMYEGLTTMSNRDYIVMTILDDPDLAGQLLELLLSMREQISPPESALAPKRESLSAPA